MAFLKYALEDPMEFIEACALEKALTSAVDAMVSYGCELDEIRIVQELHLTAKSAKNDAYNQLERNRLSAEHQIEAVEVS